MLIIIKKIKLVIEWYLIKLLFLGIEAVLHNVALQLQIRTSAPPKEMELQRFKAGPSPHRRLSTEKKKIGFRQDYGWQLIFMIKTLFKNFFKIEFSYLKNSFALHQTFFSNSMYWYVLGLLLFSRMLSKIMMCLLMQFSLPSFVLFCLLWILFPFE